MTKQILTVAIAGTTASLATAQPIFEEDFEGLELFPFVSSTEGGGDGTDWTDIPPAGWTFDNFDTPADGPAEFFGFTFLDVNSWIATAGDQSRSEFTLAEGTVMVADPDEYDDAGDIDPDLFNVLIRTPAIDLSSISSGLVEVSFDSSFRPYPTMTGLVEVSFDGGGSFSNLLTLNDSTVPGGTSSLDRANEEVSLTTDIPSGATDIIVQFRMADAGNDWWWAIDNIAVAEGVATLPGEFIFATEQRAVFETTTPVIDWFDSSLAATYDVVVSRNSDLSAPFFTATGLTETEVALAPTNSGKFFASVEAINGEGVTVISGGPLEFFIVNPCNADFDGDGALTIFDFLAFQNAFDIGCP